ncbi:uncharacterized protein PHACADRAFT_135336 [Phanerochaete carnosa HHB-10118-sp]|uniref:Uncharacterized protein n=1 Tax=Phanerochaete carnosa (strain HHB-10118-sp) TaxID=650164 RepID=K5WC80_PHACS|nr:uncharacterized protein PHACADRAFT_135336 [Phanerochaete carnosa HHB-10118-sp]EKM61568.1 hypothetical protein PHACADRAFT_135336 [Phanerochaete carnosa HHB-10118-sp]
MPSGPLSISASGRLSASDYQPLTPRTPHSRSGYAEDAITDADLDENAGSYASYRQQQSEPLLASSASPSFPASGYRSRGDDVDATAKPIKRWQKQLSGKTVLHNTPLIVGTIVAGILLSLIVVSFKKPEALDRVVGYMPNSIPSSKPVEEVIAAEPPSPSPVYIDTMPPPGLALSYENYTQFPLTGAQYRHECDILMSGKFIHHSSYWDPPKEGILDVPHHDDVTDYHVPEGGLTKVCSRTITYQLDGTVGLVADLALMAQAAALARERNRTFLVDDTYWNRGKWTDHFQHVRARQPGPEPGCRAPPPEELVACPRFARHWVVSARTAKFHLGHPFSENYEDPYQRGIKRQKPMFEHALQSFRETIRPNAHNAQLIHSARAELASVLSLPPHDPTARNDDMSPSQQRDAEPALQAHNPDPYIAVHIRRGDRHASTFPYRGHYVPLEKFVEAARGAWTRLYGDDAGESAAAFPAPPIAYVASDSHATAHEFVSAFPASTAVFSLDSSTDPALRALAPQHEYVQEEFNNMEAEDRVRLTRGMIVDLAMLSGLWAWEDDVVPGATICTFSSNICRLSAVGLGWDRAFGFGGDDDPPYINDAEKRWIDLDNRGVVLPSWTAFEVFS